MDKLTHYIFVRRDLPLGVLSAMVTHAAGESGALYADPYDGRFRGATAVVLNAQNEAVINRIGEEMRKLDIPCVEIWETGGPYDGQMMAIGVVPRARDARLNGYQLLNRLDNPVGVGSSLVNPNETTQTTSSIQATYGMADLRNQVRLALDSNEDQGASEG